MTPKASPTVDFTLHCVEEGTEDNDPRHGYHIVESMPVFRAFWVCSGLWNGYCAGMGSEIFSVVG